MDACIDCSREMLTNPVELEIKGVFVDFGMAECLAWSVARRLKEDPMLLSWYSREDGLYSPRVECCGEDKPAWLIYAESRGADLPISINNEQFVFVFWGEEKKSEN